MNKTNHKKIIVLVTSDLVSDNHMHKVCTTCIKWIFMSFGGCYPEGAGYYKETYIVYTNYVEEYDFKAVGTYSMPNIIVKITGALQDGRKGY